MEVYALVQVRQDRPYYDEERGLWLSRQVGDKTEDHNIVTDAGLVAIHTFIYGTAAQRTAASLGSGMHFVGISNDGTAPAAGDTSLAGELSGDGLDRVEGTVVLPTGSGTLTTVENVFTYTGVPAQGVQKAALFDALSGGNMAHEATFSPRTLGNGDTLTITFNITLA